MAELFEIAELVKIAVDDERTGVAFYTKLSENSDKLKDTFADLAEQEKHHQKRFEQMLSGLGDYKSPEQYPGEYVTYLRTLACNRAFPDEQVAASMAEKCKSDEEALDLAVRFERDTLILMNEMRSLVPQRDVATVDELADEERAHLVTLYEARKKVT